MDRRTEVKRRNLNNTPFRKVLSMKVWELIQKLSEAKAGADVFASRGKTTHSFNLDFVNTGDDPNAVYLIGDNSTPDDEDIDL